MGILDSEVLFSATKSFMDVLLENLALPVWYKDEKGRYIGCNSALASFLGMDKSHILGRTTGDIFPRELALELDSFDRKVLESGRNQSFETRLPHADESSHEVIIFLAPFFRRDGVLGGVSGNLVDMNESKRKEKQTLALVTTRNKLLAVLGHDLKGPMAKFQQLLGYYQKDRKVFTPEEWDELFADMYKSADSINKLLENLLFWSLGQEGKLKPKFEAFDVADLFREISDLFLSGASGKNISFSVESGLKKPVVSDRNMIAVVLRNLVENALKFTPRGGQVKLSVHEDSEGSLCFSVADTGLGISKSLLHSLFKGDPDIHYNGTEHEKGTGFGLSLCAELAQALGGQMRVESELGQGSTFTLCLGAEDL